MDLQRSREQLEHDYEVAKFHFITTELDVALTFCEMAISTTDESKAERTAKYARQAYESAARFIPGAHLTLRMHEKIDERLTRLEPLLRRLPERE